MLGGDGTSLFRIHSEEYPEWNTGALVLKPLKTQYDILRRLKISFGVAIGRVVNTPHAVEYQGHFSGSDADRLSAFFKSIGNTPAAELVMKLQPVPPGDTLADVSALRGHIGAAVGQLEQQVKIA